MGKEPVCWPFFQERFLMTVSPVAVLCLHLLSAMAE